MVYELSIIGELENNEYRNLKVFNLIPNTKRAERSRSANVPHTV